METSDGVPENLKARLKDSYDAIAEKYTAWAASTADIRVGYLDKLLALLAPAHKDILEIGCGAGIPTTERLLAHSPDFCVTANDLSSSQIALGKARLKEVASDADADRVKWIEGDMMALGFTEASFDVVLGFYTIQHLPCEEQVSMIGKIIKWLRPGGFMLMNFPAEEYEHAVMTGWMGDKGWIFHSGLGTARYKKLVTDAGMEVMLSEVKQDNVKAQFLWVIARKPH